MGNTISEQLPKDEILLDVSTISDVCSSWKSKVNGLNLTGDRVNNDFKVLSSFGILENYITCLATAVNSLTTTINSICTSINDAKDAHVMIDTKNVGNGNGGVSSVSVVTGSGSGSSTSDYSRSSAIASPVTTQKTVIEKPIISPEIDVNYSLSTISSSDLAGIAICIYQLKSDSIDDFYDVFTNDNSVSLLKDTMLKSINISDETKNIIQSMDIDTLKKELKSISNENVLDIPVDDSLSILGKYIKSQAEFKNISVDSLLNDSKKSATLDEIVTKFYDTANAFKKIVPDSSFISRINMLKIVNGENPYNLNSDDNELVKDMISMLSDSRGVTLEEYIATGNVERDINNILDSYDYINELKELDEDSVQHIASVIV